MGRLACAHPKTPPSRLLERTDAFSLAAPSHDATHVTGRWAPRTREGKGHGPRAARPRLDGLSPLTIAPAARSAAAAAAQAPLYDDDRRATRDQHETERQHPAQVQARERERARFGRRWARGGFRRFFFVFGGFFFFFGRRGPRFRFRRRRRGRGRRR